MRLKGKKFRERISDLIREGIIINGVIASRSLKLVFKHLFFELPTGLHAPLGACLRFFEWFLHGKARHLCL
jgi:hypothetical protein